MVALRPPDLISRLRAIYFRSAPALGWACPGGVTIGRYIAPPNAPKYIGCGFAPTKKGERVGDMRSCQSWLHRHKADRGPTLHPMTKTTLHLEGASQSSAQFNGNVSRSWNYQREL